LSRPPNPVYRSKRHLASRIFANIGYISPPDKSSAGRSLALPAGVTFFTNSITLCARKEDVIAAAKVERKPQPVFSPAGRWFESGKVLRLIR